MSKKSRKAVLFSAGLLLLAGVARAEEPAPAYEEKGEASFYGADFQGKKTASGEKFDQNEKTAAHPDLPLGTEVTVKNTETGKETQVEITDRGPYAKDRAIDLSKSAAKAIGIDGKDGVATVEIEATKEQIEEGKKDDVGPKEGEAKDDDASAKKKVANKDKDEPEKAAK